MKKNNNSSISKLKLVRIKRTLKKLENTISLHKTTDPDNTKKTPYLLDRKLAQLGLIIRNTKAVTIPLT